MSNSYNGTSTLSKSAEIVESKLSFKFTPLQWSKFNQPFPLLILHQLSINPHKVKNISVEISLH